MYEELDEVSPTTSSPEHQPSWLDGVRGEFSRFEPAADGQVSDWIMRQVEELRKALADRTVAPTIEALANTIADNIHRRKVNGQEDLPAELRLAEAIAARCGTLQIQLELQDFRATFAAFLARERGTK